ncbi:unnamed protein product [Blepharisma stoltei]|uniref:Heat shock protein 70 n=1 Tax=Blepharisma stoltei TaxID=1481888 RepID=A0AAU9I7M6_9CILI|nr:unnamed protein product [Blepharisma stoltei]
MTHYCIADFMNKTGISLNGNTRAVVRLRAACERAKIVLSSAQQTFIEVDSLVEGVDYSAQINRVMFEEQNSVSFRECIPPIERVLKDSGYAKNQIHEIVLAGGSSRIPKVRQLIQEYFNGKELWSGFNPDEIVGYGAAVIGGILSGDYSEQIQDILLIDVIPFSLGVETYCGVMKVLIPRNSSISIKKTEIFTSYADNVSGICIQVFEGEGSMTRDNRFLGRFNLEGINPAPRGVPQIEVTLSVDTNSILELSAKDLKSGKTLQL